MKLLFPKNLKVTVCPHQNGQNKTGFQEDCPGREVLQKNMQKNVKKPDKMVFFFENLLISEMLIDFFLGIQKKTKNKSKNEF